MLKVKLFSKCHQRKKTEENTCCNRHTRSRSPDSEGGGAGETQEANEEGGSY